MSAGLFSGDIFFRVRSRHDQKVTQLELLTLQVKPFWLRKTSMGFPWVFGGDHVSEKKTRQSQHQKHWRDWDVHGQDTSEQRSKPWLFAARKGWYFLSLLNPSYIGSSVSRIRIPLDKSVSHGTSYVRVSHCGQVLAVFGCHTGWWIIEFKSTLEPGRVTWSVGLPSASKQ